MRRFDDFDAWGDAVSGASLRLACDGIESREWTLGSVVLDDVVLQVASEGGGNICYGGNAHPGTILFLPLTEAEAHVTNGEPLDEASLLAIPRGADFRIHVRRRAHAWCSIALPFDVVAPVSWIARSPEAVPRLRRLVTEVARSLLQRPADTAAHRVAGRELAAAAAACLSAPAKPKTALGRPRLDRSEITRRAMEVLDHAAILPPATDLAAEVGVTSRTLLRTFQESFGVSPKRYLMLRELHGVRRSLRTGSPEGATVADVLTRHGIWEFGRFAARYRRHFGELPSETLRQRG